MVLAVCTWRGMLITARTYHHGASCLYMERDADHSKDLSALFVTMQLLLFDVLFHSVEVKGQTLSGQL